MRYLLLFFAFGWISSAVFSPKAQGQALHIGSEQLVTVSPATQVALNGNLRNQGTLLNQGSIQISGDWSNEGTYDDALGSEVILSGADQILNHSAQQFSHLIVRGTGTKTLASAVRVTDTLTLAEGVLASATSTILTLEATATVAGGSDQAYVESTMAYQGTGRRHFPLGLAGAYLPLTLTDVTGEQPVLRVSVASPNPPATLDESLVSVSTARYWRIETVAGRFDGSPAALPVNQADELDDLLGAVVAQAAEPGGQFTNLGQSDRNGDVFRGAVTSAEVVTQPIVAVGVTSLFSMDNQVLVPSAFAPEAPNPTNRSVKVYAKTLRADSFLFRIFDRWGNLVYQTASLTQAQEQGWAGTRSSGRSLATAGVYQYHVRGIFENGAPVDQSGTITLFR